MVTATGWDPARWKSSVPPTAVGKHKFVKLRTFSQTVPRTRFAIRGLYFAIRDWARWGAAKCSTEQAQTPPFAPGLSWPAFACGLFRTATEGRFPRLAPG